MGGEKGAFVTESEIGIVRGLGLRLVETEFCHFSEEGTDNSEYVAAVKRIADTAFMYLMKEAVNDSICFSVKRELIEKARELFIQEWMKPLDDDEELPDADEAVERFDYFLGE
jgi:hypothetical protein